MIYSCLYLAEIRSIQNRCKFATICDRKGYIPSDMGPGTGSHIASDMRPEGRITLGISDRGGGGGGGQRWGPISLLHRCPPVTDGQTCRHTDGQL